MWRQTTLGDFADGVLDGLQLLDHGDGALSLDSREQAYLSRGVYTSVVKLADFEFNALGIQWHARVPQHTSLEISVRMGTDTANWTPWQDIVEPGREGDHFFALTPLILAGGRYVQYRLTLTTLDLAATPRLEDVAITYIDSTTGPSLSNVEHLPLGDLPATGQVPQPPIVSRAGWGANESYRFDAHGHEVWPLEYEAPQKIIIHHSVTLNYDVNPPATVRAIYYYRTVTLGWGDIGYSYLIDWRGNTYEGRYGGPDVVGGHAHNYNRGSVGVCAMGTYGNTSSSVPPTPELLEGLVSLSAWECGRSLIHPAETSVFVDKLTQNIAGHRDYNATACPGDHLYAELPSLRSKVWDEIVQHTPPYYAEYLGHDTPQTMLPGQTYHVTVSMRNLGTLTWAAGGQNPVRLGYRWHDDQDGVIPGTVHAPLPHDVAYTHGVEVDSASAEAPEEPGHYTLEWDLLHEDVTWFSLEGSPSLRVPVIVFDPNVWNRTYVPLALRIHSQPPPTPSAPDNELIVNGGFERDTAWHTPATSRPADYSISQAHGGNRSMRTGIENAEDNAYSYSSAWQAVSIPATATVATLRFWEYSVSQETATWQMRGQMSFTGDPRLLQATDDSQYVLVLDENGDWLGTLLWQRSNGQTWLKHGYDLSAYIGQTIRLHFGTVNDGQDGVTAMFVDDVSLKVRDGT